MTTTRTPKVPTGTIAWLVDRLHVSATPTEVVRMIRTKMSGPGWSKALRKFAYRAAIKRHVENRATFNRVMAGDLR